MSSRWLRQAWKRRVALPVLKRLHPEIEATVGLKRIRVNLRGGILDRTLYLHGEWEPQLHALMRAMSLAGEVCVDVGAYRGVHSVMMSDLVGPVGTVVAFEPAPQNFKILQHNLRRNRATNVVVHHSAVGDRLGTGRLLLNPRNFGDNRVAAPDAYAWASCEVPLTTLDESLARFPAGRIAFVKIDVQGYEAHVIRGMQTVIEQNPQIIIALEVFPDGLRAAGSSPGELMRLLEKRGLSGWEFDRFRLLPAPAPWVYDLMRGGSVDVIVARDQERLRRVVSQAYDLSLPPTT